MLQVHAEPSESEESDESSHFDWGESKPEGKRDEDEDGGEDEAEGEEAVVSTGMSCTEQGAGCRLKGVLRLQGVRSIYDRWNALISRAVPTP